MTCDEGCFHKHATRSIGIAELTKALSKAQGAMGFAKKDANNPFYSSKYADLASVWDACREPLSANGLAVIQISVKPSEPNRVAVDTILSHSSGEWISGVLELTPVKADPQSVGSAITYARRYGLQAIVGIAPEDDDGNAASGTDKAGTNPQLWPKALTKAEVAEKAAKGELRGQKPFVRPPSPEAKAEAEAWANEPSGDMPFEERIKGIEGEVKARLAKHPGDPAPNGHCTDEKCGAPLVTMTSESKEHNGRKYLICHVANQERARMRAAGASEALIGQSIRSHTRMWI